MVALAISCCLLSGSFAQTDATDAQSQFDLAGAHCCTNTAPKDDADAVKSYHKAADEGDILAQYGLGECYKNVDEAPTNIVESYNSSKISTSSVSETQNADPLTNQTNIDQTLFGK